MTVDHSFSGYINDHEDIENITNEIGSPPEPTFRPIESLDFLKDGTLIGIQPGPTSTTFYEINTATGSVRNIGEIGFVITAMAAPTGSGCQCR